MGACDPVWSANSGMTEATTKIVAGVSRAASAPLQGRLQYYRYVGDTWSDVGISIHIEVLGAFGYSTGSCGWECGCNRARARSCCIHGHAHQPCMDHPPCPSLMLPHADMVWASHGLLNVADALGNAPTMSAYTACKPGLQGMAPFVLSRLAGIPHT